MDGAIPIIKRGKERETPKRKKPTLLKKVLILLLLTFPVWIDQI